MDKIALTRYQKYLGQIKNDPEKLENAILKLTGDSSKTLYNLEGIKTHLATGKQLLDNEDTHFYTSLFKDELNPWRVMNEGTAYKRMKDRQNLIKDLKNASSGPDKKYIRWKILDKQRIHPSGRNNPFAKLRQVEEDALRGNRFSGTIENVSKNIPKRLAVAAGILGAGALAGLGVKHLIDKKKNIDTHKDNIYKTAMALSTRNFESARRSALEMAAKFRRIRYVQIKP
jgi:hypothetical protein